MNKILLVESHVIVGRGIQSLLEEYFQGVEIIHKLPNEDILEILKKDKFTLLVIDPGHCSDFDLFVQLKERHPEVAILACCETEDTYYAIKLMKAGAHGFISKNTSKEEFFFALDSVKTGRRYMSPKLFEEAFEDLISFKYVNPQINTLSQKEIQIAQCLVEGTAIKGIATKLNLSSSAVSNYKRNIFKKLSISTIIELDRYLRA